MLTPELLELNNKYIKDLKKIQNKSIKEAKKGIKTLPDEQQKILNRALEDGKKGIQPDFDLLVKKIKDAGNV